MGQRVPSTVMPPPSSRPRDLGPPAATAGVSHGSKVEYDRDLGFLGSTALTYHANTKATGAC